MESNWPRLSKHQMSLNSVLCVGNIFGYCYHLINGISYDLAQREPIKRRPLYLLYFPLSQKSKTIFHKNKKQFYLNILPFSVGLSVYLSVFVFFICLSA